MAVTAVPAFAARSPLVGEAVAFAMRAHGGQVRRCDGAPFILHPLEVAGLLDAEGGSDAVVAAGVLHDVLEDTPTTRDELTARFGAEVAAIVQAVSDRGGPGGWAARKARLREAVARAGRDAQLVFAADRVSKARELRIQWARGVHEDRDALRLAHHRAGLELLERELGEHGLVTALRVELQTLRTPV